MKKLKSLFLKVETSLMLLSLHTLINYLMLLLEKCYNFR